MAMPACFADPVMIDGKDVDAATGLLVDVPGSYTNWEPVDLEAGSTVSPAQPGIRLRIRCYTDSFDESLARTYAYDAESNWTTFQPDLGPADWLSSPSEPWVAPRRCFVRVTAQLPANAAIPERLCDVAVVKAGPERPAPLPGALQAETDRVCERVRELREPGDLALIVLSDVHYSTGCIWPQTARTIQDVASRIHPDAIVQLGDVSDGIAPAKVTRSFVGRVLGDLHVCGVPVLGCVGNHDVNYFKDNVERLSALECARLYTERDELWYLEDFPQARVRCFFLKSYDRQRNEHYGYEREEVRWLRRELRRTPSGWRVLVFSHVPLYAEIHYWSKTLLNEKPLVRALERFNWRRRGALVGFVHGHSHVDQVFWKGSFPDISIGCAKFEDFQDRKPAHSITPSRVRGEKSQELWNVFILKAREPRLEMVRFGAGEDRSVMFHDRPR